MKGSIVKTYTNTLSSSPPPTTDQVANMTQLFRGQPPRIEFHQSLPQSGTARGGYMSPTPTPSGPDPPFLVRYEHLPPSSNPRGWTFESTGCRLYGLGLTHLTPVTEQGVTMCARTLHRVT
ncbi:hypothetical protein B0H13DRAFT_1920364 [Mycena leptocephala]|nr:hypothetical protein B0H13DRAFT_1920364 [Mycena leptocephala]